MNFLKLIGAVSAAEHERAIRPFRERLFDSEQKRIHWQGEANEFAAKYKAAITDLAGATDTIGDFKIALDRMEKDRDNWRDQALRDGPDAEKWRDRAARELQRGQAKRDANAPKKGAK